VQRPDDFLVRLSFSEYCGRRISTGAFIVWLITAKKRMAGLAHEQPGAAFHDHITEVSRVNLD
jgi:hypothetical protein